MTDASTTSKPTLPSIVHGIPLSEEPGLGALTLPGYLREVTERFASREAMVMHYPDGTVERWSYSELWDRAMSIARSLVACGVGKDSRVGVLMTNRPEMIASVFGAGLAGGVAVALSTFSTVPELEYLLKASGVSILLFERTVLKKDFATMLQTIEPEIGRAEPGRLMSAKLPFLRRLAMVDTGSDVGAIETWQKFLAHGSVIPSTLVDAMAAAVKPADPGLLLFSSGSTGKSKGILNSHRGVTIQCWRWARLVGAKDDVRCWSANGFFWSGNFCMALGGTFSVGGSLVLQATFDAVQALELMQAERVTLPVAWPHQFTQLAAAPNYAEVDLSSMRYLDRYTAMARHPTVKTDWDEPRWAYGNTETFTVNTCFPACSPQELTGDSHGEPLPGNTLKIVDPLTGSLLPRGQSGEIAVKGPTLMLGYIGVPNDEVLDQDGFFPTGDGGYIDDRGRLVWEGRLGDIIKTGGANVSPIEVDTEVQMIPGVKLSQTVGVPHADLGEMVVTCIVRDDNATLDETKIRDLLKSRLASFKIPRKVLFVSAEDLAMTGSAKVKTSALRELAAKRLSAA